MGNDSDSAVPLQDANGRHDDVHLSITVDITSLSQRTAEIATSLIAVDGVQHRRVFRRAIQQRNSASRYTTPAVVFPQTR